MKDLLSKYIVRGEFTLHSGFKSDYKLDLKPGFLSGELDLSLSSDADYHQYAGEINNLAKFYPVVTLGYGGLLFFYSINNKVGHRRVHLFREKRGAWNLSHKIEGDRVVVLDDVYSTGSSLDEFLSVIHVRTYDYFCLVRRTDVGPFSIRPNCMSFLNLHDGVFS